ncbi:hypothetical protein QH494_13870 [Sphingomonas sp. AR_OL41]|uniref:hypothetical protein n=1 Tax=Sphingomonas sp. AR_OL41 TaxID=3042729 RepID=UPI00247FB14E|nr:hypothetical protein [Sphingomonas sp. AR_OL41]MDH7973272.1 hypothetical protein [Sphingomonas sp. AR_OL41]
MHHRPVAMHPDAFAGNRTRYGTNATAGRSYHPGIDAESPAPDRLAHRIEDDFRRRRASRGKKAHDADKAPSINKLKRKRIIAGNPVAGIGSTTERSSVGFIPFASSLPAQLESADCIGCEPDLPNPSTTLLAAFTAEAQRSRLVVSNHLFALAQ